MRIFYTNKIIFWSNEGNDYLEKNKFDEYLNDWVELSNTKSVNWPDVYNVNFYSSDNFEATYFKIIKNNFTYYFFIQDIGFVSNNGKQYSLTLDFYNTYTINFIEKLKQENPLVFFKRKHCNRYFKDSSGIYFDILNKQSYLNSVPQYLNQYTSYILPVSNTPLIIAPVQSLMINNIKYPSSTTETQGIEITDNDFQIGSPYKYYYLKVKKPSSVFTTNQEWKYANAAQILYIPLKNIYEGNNSYTNLAQFPSSYVVGMIATNLPPSKFNLGGLVKDVYGGDNTIPYFNNNNSIVLFPQRKGVVYDDGGINYQFDYTFINNLTDTYNIDNFENEIMLHLSPFTTYNISNNYSFGLNYFLTNHLSNLNKIKLIYLVSTTIYVSIGYKNSLYENTYFSSLYFDSNEETPFSGDVFNNYLLNNINSINTGIALKKEENTMNRNWNIINGVFGSVGAIADIGLSLATAGLSSTLAGGISGVKGGASGIGSLFSSILSPIQSQQKSEFALKSLTQKTEAQVADVGNKPDAMLDTYGDGSVRIVNSNIMISKSTLPDNYKKLIFSDFYFHGYIYENVDYFLTYNNRINFNYFEIGNSYQLASQYLKYPKNILKDLARQVESGIRIWKTNNFDFTMKLDNKEISYA